MALVCVGLLAGAPGAAAQQTELAYYVSDPNEAGTEIEMVVAEDTAAAKYHSILQANHMVQDPPVADPVELFEAIESSSDILVDDVFPPVPTPEAADEEGTGEIVPNDESEAALESAALESAALEGADDPPAPTPIDPVPIAPMLDMEQPAPQESASPENMLVPVPLESAFREANTISSDSASAFTRRRPYLGANTASYSSAPNMVGDHFGGTLLFGTGNHTISSAGGDRRFKIAENVSPMPQDRVFFNYNHFENSLRDLNNVNRSLDRFTFGFEKTLFDGHASFELRLPIADGLDSRQAFGVADTTSTEFGNLAMAVKVNLLSGCNWILSGGTTISVPTGDDFRAINGNALDILVRNDAVHLAPFIGYLNQLSDDWFFQGFIQADFDLEGNEVFTAAGGFEGIVQDQNLLFIDASIGRWLCRRCDPCARLTGVAAIAELHYTSTMTDTDTVSAISNPYNRMDILNASGALSFQLRQTSLRVGAAAPLREDEERLFDAEIIFQLNRRF